MRPWRSRSGHRLPPDVARDPIPESMQFDKSDGAPPRVPSATGVS